MLDLEKCLQLNTVIAVLVLVVLVIIVMVVYKKRNAPEGWMTGGSVVSVQKMDESYFH